MAPMISSIVLPVVPMRSATASEKQEQDYRHGHEQRQAAADRLKLLPGVFHPVAWPDVFSTMRTDDGFGLHSFGAIWAGAYRGRGRHRVGRVYLNGSSASNGREREPPR